MTLSSITAAAMPSRVPYSVVPTKRACRWNRIFPTASIEISTRTLRLRQLFPATIKDFLAIARVAVVWRYTPPRRW